MHAKVSDAKDKMHKAVVHMQDEFGAIRTGRATPSIVEKLRVDYYGAETPLQQLASFTAPEARIAPAIVLTSLSFFDIEERVLYFAISTVRRSVDVRRRVSMRVSSKAGTSNLVLLMSRSTALMSNRVSANRPPRCPGSKSEYPERTGPSPNPSLP